MRRAPPFPLLYGVRGQRALRQPELPQRPLPEHPSERGLGTLVGAATDEERVALLEGLHDHRQLVRVVPGDLSRLHGLAQRRLDELERVLVELGVGLAHAGVVRLR